MTAVGLLHPGAMGAAIGALLVGAGHEVAWASTGRGEATARRAAAAGLDDAVTVGALAARCTVLVAVCPPHAARDVADEVAATGFGGLYLEADAVAPVTTLAVAAALTPARTVDGGIIGPPPTEAGTTRLYLSGPDHAEVAALFAGTPLEVVACGDAVGRASAVKLAFAAWSKGSQALRLAVADLAEAAGVAEEWRDASDWDDPGAADALQRAAARAGERGWRWAGEMDEITAMAKSVAVPSGFWSAAAARYSQETRPAER